MRALLLGVFLLAAPFARGGMRPVGGTEARLGDIDVSPVITSPSVTPTSVEMATDGDEVVLAWVSRNTICAQRLDRNGALLTALPVRIAGRRFINALRVLHAGGDYLFFFSARLNVPPYTTLEVVRVSRDLEIVESRVLANDLLQDAVISGDDIVLSLTASIWVLRADLSVVARMPKSEGSTLVPSPQGTLLLTAKQPVISARMLDDSNSVRIADAHHSDAAIAGVWTGTEYLIAWSDYSTKVAVLDAGLRLVGTHVLSSCSDCDVRVTALGNGEALVSWTHDYTLAVRVRGGEVAGESFSLGRDATPFRTSSGVVFAVDGLLNVRTFVPGATLTPSTEPVVATMRGAAQESFAAAVASATEVAVARHRDDGKNFVSILDRQGRTLRQVRIADGYSVALTHDGRDFYALVTWPYSPAYFQKVAEGATPVRLDISAASMLHWTGDEFLILQSGYSDFTGRFVSRTRALSLTHEGRIGLPRCPMWELPTPAGEAPVAVERGAGETVIILDRYVARLRDGCGDAPPEPLQTLSDSRFASALGDGLWGRVTIDRATGLLVFSLAGDLVSPALEHRIARRNFIDYFYEPMFDLAFLGGKWLTVWTDADGLHGTVQDESGRLEGTSLLAAHAFGRMALVRFPSGEVLAFYNRTFDEAPYFGASRVMAMAVTLESETRRRSTRS